ncbi:MAG: hypothetical protein GY878_02695 [Fuerstiella sp.]|nr:hypothetical protein [Fuerstiella sp.]
MSTSFQSCPGCEAFILSDTKECPQCGHVVDANHVKEKETSEAFGTRKFRDMFDPCPKCSELVRSGLVRCWNCNAFMRADIEAKYRELKSKPQAIIFSDIPLEERTEMLPATETTDGGHPREMFDAEEEDNAEFTLNNLPASDGAGAEFELDMPAAAAAAPQPSAPAAKPVTSEKTSETAAPEKAATAASEQSTSDKAKADDAAADDSASKETAPTENEDKSSGDIDDVDLVGIAMQDEKEEKRRQRGKVMEWRRKRILLPCSCGAWIRVSQDQGGRTLRCKQCKNPFIVPDIKKKEKGPQEAQRSKAPQIKLGWLEDLQLHVISPTDVVLKPGSLAKTYENVDGIFHESGLYLVKYAAQAKKSMFGKAAEGPPATGQQRAQTREHIQKTGAVAELPFGELHTVAAKQTAKIRLIQPVTEAHESMFAGVPVFGEGRIALYMPLELEENRQAFISMPLSVFRRFSEQASDLFGLKIPAEDNGVPAAEESDTLFCFLSEVKVEAAKNVVYYENDPGFDLELSGYVCGACGVAITESSRKNKKLGGAAGKGLAKAKCPKCSNKFGDRKAYRVTAKAADAEEVEDVGDVLKPKAQEAAAIPASAATDESTS